MARTLSEAGHSTQARRQIRRMVRVRKREEERQHDAVHDAVQNEWDDSQQHGRIVTVARLYEVLGAELGEQGEWPEYTSFVFSGP